MNTRHWRWIAPLVLWMAPAFAFADTYFPVDFSVHHNASLHVTVPGAPVGSVTLGGIPFEIPVSGNNYWDGWYAGGPGTEVRSIEFPVALQGVREVHTLINTHWGTAGGPFAWIEFYGSTGVYFRKDLFADDDIRDHSPYCGWASVINGTTTINVWNNGLSGSAYVVVDKQQIALPPEFWNETLERIRLTDAGLGEYHQRLMLVGVTAACVEPTSVEIDIKPGSYPNSVNLGSHGVIPVAILSSATFDATQVDPATVLLSGAGLAQVEHF